MDRDAISQCHHTQIAPQFGDINPVANSSVLRLHLAPQGIRQGLPAPFELDVRPFGQHLLAKVIRYL